MPYNTTQCNPNAIHSVRGGPVHIISYYIYHVISYHIMSYISCHVISRHIMSYHTISYHIISYHIIPYHIISYHIYIYELIVLYCIVPTHEVHHKVSDSRIPFFCTAQKRESHDPRLLVLDSPISNTQSKRTRSAHSPCTFVLAVEGIR